jgi:hypothetical protein
MEDAQTPATSSRAKQSKANGQDEAKSFKPNLGAFANGDNDDEDDDEFSDLDEDEESNAEEFSGFAGAADDATEDGDEDEDDEDADMVISEPSLPSDAELDSDDEGDNVNLRDFVDSLPGGKKRKVAFEDGDALAEGAADAEVVGKKKRRVLPSMQGPGGRDEGGDFGLNPSE